MANTPFLDLVKPAGTDHALVSVINSNSDKIDEGFGTLSEQIGDTFNLSTGHVTAIPSGSNLNNYTTPGVYSVANYSTATGITNIPTASAGRLIVSYGAAGADYKRQIYIPYSSNAIFIRYNATSWSAWEQLAAGTEFNTVSISALADLRTYLDNMPTGKTSTLLLSGEASNAVCGSTYTCNVTVSKVDGNFADLRWSRSNADAGFARYQKTSQTFVVEHLVTSEHIQSVSGTNFTLQMGNYASALCVAFVQGIGSCTFDLRRTGNDFTKTLIAGVQAAMNAITATVVSGVVTITASASTQLTAIISNKS